MYKQNSNQRIVSSVESAKDQIIIGFQNLFQVRGHLVQEAAVRVGHPPDEHQDRLQGQLQVRGARATIGGQRGVGRAAAGGGVLAHRQVLPHLLSHSVLHLQHHLLAGIHSLISAETFSAPNRTFDRSRREKKMRRKIFELTFCRRRVASDLRKLKIQRLVSAPQWTGWCTAVLAESTLEEGGGLEVHGRSRHVSTSLNVCV